MIGRLRNRATLQRTAVRLALAGTLGIASMLAAESWLDGHGAADAAVPMAEVLVTAHALEAGSRLVADDLVRRRWPVDAIDRSWLGPGRDGAGGMVGQIVVARLAAGTPLSRAMVLESGSGFAAAIGPGRRAVSIAVSPAGGLAGFLSPGDHVDVLLTQTLGKRHTVQTLLTDLPVLGVDQRGQGDRPAAATADDEDIIADTLGDDAAPPGLVTLDVSPGEAEALAVAAELGTLSLVLRGPGAEARPAGTSPARTTPARTRRWDSDVTGLPVSVLAASDSIAATPPPVLAAPVTAPAGGVEITYGLQPQTSESPK
jgi:pilus assembly protein CpaB